MKLATLSASILVIACCGIASAQGRPRARQATAKPVFNSQALAATQADLVAAISSMTSALPIYDGDRVKSIHLAHRALLIVDHEIAGNKAAARQTPKVHDHVPSKNAHVKYTPQQVAASQAAMNQGLQSLNKAASDYQAAAGGASANKGASKAYGFIGQAIGEANAAIAIHNH